MIDDLFDESEFAELVFYFNDDRGRMLQVDNLSGRTKKDKATALVMRFDRRGALYDLVEKCRDLRPAAPWPMVDNTGPLPL